ncbi:MAG: sterol desaturase family protein [Bdellovibrionota bacterium]
MDSMVHGSAWETFWLFSLAMGIRYWVIAGGLHLLVWYGLRNRFASALIRPNPPAFSTMKREMFWSMLAIPVFGSTAFFLHWSNGIGLTSVDIGSFADHGWVKAAFYFVALILMHDTYFYWVHRWMHHPAVFKRVHKVHHLSNYPSAFAAYSFHPLETVIEMMFFPLAIVLLPGVHFYTVVAFFSFDFFINTLAHTGIEYMSASVRESRWGRWLNTATLHSHHHANSQGNYGFFFSFWDRVCGTLRPG